MKEKEKKAKPRYVCLEFMDVLDSSGFFLYEFPWRIDAPLV